MIESGFFVIHSTLYRLFHDHFHDHYEFKAFIWIFPEMYLYTSLEFIIPRVYTDISLEFTISSHTSLDHLCVDRDLQMFLERY